jgi:uncharacterized protein YutE (UPF0331/DUF86 family)
MVDETLILRRLSELDEYHQQVKEYQNMSVDRYRRDWKVQRIIERTLQMMIETCVDITSHIIAERNYRTPKSYADAFKVLNENSILNAKLFTALEKMAKFRNVVVHHYDQVDAEIVVGILKHHLNDFEDYKGAVIRFLKAQSTK